MEKWPEVGKTDCTMLLMEDDPDEFRRRAMPDGLPESGDEQVAERVMVTPVCAYSDCQLKLGELMGVVFHNNWQNVAASVAPDCPWRQASLE